MTELAPDYTPAFILPPPRHADLYQDVAHLVAAEARKMGGGMPNPPSQEEREAYLDETAPRLWFWGEGIFVTLPVLGSAHMRRGDDDAPAFRCVRKGWVELRALGCRFQMVMPERGSGAYILVPEALQRIGHWPWCVLGVPVLLAALVPAMLYRAAFGENSWRVRRLWMRLMWKLRPAFMDAKVGAWRVQDEVDASASRLMRAKWAADDAARQAAREAAFEAEVERRLAERLASASGA
ncbi:hypothetical protein [Ancylobacter amanitiformis]|uniref:Uncharacterized protein n=1 Tax=Ancylobacter amanitiformis TaxID=217069 RepID=A0ABU0LPJ3_9HYPH|nr:hypothetical protein [Ancylobacter amanitiformis]MDQ0510623.1 hypothetical protein [Ancylobacter amanitiformis]